MFPEGPYQPRRCGGRYHGGGYYAIIALGVCWNGKGYAIGAGECRHFGFIGVLAHFAWVMER